MPVVIGKDESLAKRVSCKKCGSIVEYFPIEVKSIKHSYDYLGDYSVNSGISCPCCESNIFVDY